MHNQVEGEAYEVQNLLPVDGESRRLVGHETLALCGANRAAQVGLSAGAELALLALCVPINRKHTIITEIRRTRSVERDNMVALYPSR